MLAFTIACSALYSRLSPFLPACPFGSDLEYPTRTVCERTFGGLWSSLSIGLLAGGGAVLLGLLVALLARWHTPTIGRVLPRIAEIVFSIPDVLVLIAVGFVARVLQDARGIHVSPYWLTIAALIVVGWAGPTQMITERLRALERAEHVMAARALGASDFHVLVRHVLSAITGFLAAIFLNKVPSAIIAESTVSFLGFGLPPDHASLGTYLGQNYKVILFGEWRVIVPSWLLLLAIVFGFHLAAHAFAAGVHRSHGKAG